MPLKPSYLLLAGAGAIVAYSGFKGKGVSSAIRQLIEGQPPALATTDTANQITSAAAAYGYNAAVAGQPQSGTPSSGVGAGVLVPGAPLQLGNAVARTKQALSNLVCGPGYRMINGRCYPDNPNQGGLFPLICPEGWIPDPTGTFCVRLHTGQQGP